MCYRTAVLLLVLAWGCTEQTNPASAPRAPRSLDADWLKRYSETGRFNRGLPRKVKFTPDGTAALFLQSPPDTKEQDLMRLDLVSGTIETLLTAARLLGGSEEALSEAEMARRERARERAGGITSFLLAEDGSFLVVPFSGGLHLMTLEESSSIRELPLPGGEPVVAPRLSPNGQHLAYTRGPHLFVYDLAGNRERRVVSAVTDNTHVGRAEFVAQEEMGRSQGFWWSPDSKRIAYQRTDESEVTLLRRPSYVTNATVAQRYPKPGEANASVTLETVSLWGGGPTRIEWDREAFPYLAAVRWRGDAPLTLVVQDRPQHTLVVLAADEGGVTRELLRETDPAWINLDPHTPRWVSAELGFLWASERDGDWQLELRDGAGQLERVVVPAAIGYRGLVGVHDSRIVVDVGENPTVQRVMSIDLGTGEQTVLSPSSGFSYGLAVSDGGAVAVQSESLSAPRSVRVFSVHGERMIPSRAESSPLKSTTRILELNGAERSYYAAVTLPTERSPGEIFPGLFYVYGGPHASMVDERGSRMVLDQWLADSGFVVFRLDVRGTPRRGRDWERAIDGDFYRVQLDDQVEAVALLGATVPELDLTRVGVYGWSFGGYATAMAVMRAPETFHAGVAGAPVVDWADYDTHYTERYIGVPENAETDPSYRTSDVSTYASKLSRPLMVLHGTADDNVFFSHSLKLSDALTREGKPHALVPLSRQAHGITHPELVTGMYLSAIRFLRDALREPKTLSPR